jgi:ribosome recycling factor
MPDIKNLINQTREQMDKAFSHLESELLKIRAGKANPQMLDGVSVDYYGTNTSLSQIGNINTPDARTIVIQPWEKNMLGPIEKAILGANLGFNPQNDGLVIRITVPPLTEERRKDLVKKAKVEVENGKVTVRNLRRDGNESIKKAIKDDGLAEDIAKDTEAKIQDLTNTYITKIDKLLEVKEKEIMTV